MIVTLGSIRGAPGVTSWSLLLAAAWPSEDGVERVVLEADPAGGVLAARYGLGVDPGVVSFIAGLRRREGAEVVVEAQARPVSDGLWVMPGPESAERARSVWTGMADDVARQLEPDDRAWFVDAGRLDESNPSLGFVGCSEVTLLVTGSRPEDLMQVPSRIASLQQRCTRIALLVVGNCPYAHGELGGFAGTGLVWTVEPKGDLFEAAGAALATRRGRRSWIWRQALDLAAGVASEARAAGSAERHREAVHARASGGSR